MEIPIPNSKEANKYIKNRLKAYIYRLFLKSKEQKLKLTDVLSSFPSITESAIRKRLRGCSDFQVII